MELHTDLAVLREKYQKIMAKFTYQDKEPEAKERLRHLFHNQITFVSSLAPEPEDWNAWTEECIQKMDWPGLCQVMNQRSKSAMMPVIYGGYNCPLYAGVLHLWKRPGYGAYLTPGAWPGEEL